MSKIEYHVEWLGEDKHRLVPLQNIDINKLDITICYNGVMGETFTTYGELIKTSSEDLIKELDEQFGILESINVKSNPILKVHEKPIILLDGFCEHGIRIYLAELGLDEYGDWVADFCADYVCETDEEFNKLIERLK